jgi:hypothetical protein
MANVPVKVLLFLSSYAPLLVILAVRDSFRSWWASVGLSILALLAVLALWGYLLAVESLEPITATVKGVVVRSGESMSYIVSYLLPFLDARLDEPRTALSLGILLSIIGIIYVNSNMLHINPILNLVGFHVYEVETTEGRTAMLISRRTYVRPGEEIVLVTLGDYVWLEKR